MTTKDAKKTAASTVEAVKGRSTEMVAEKMQAARKQTAEAAGKAGEAMKEAAESRATAAKGAISDQGDAAADRLRDAAAERGDTLRGRLLDVVADGVSEASDDLRGMSVSSIITRTEDFARRHPGAFIAGAAVAGFALARFAQASDPAKRRSSGERWADERPTGDAEKFNNPVPGAGYPASTGVNTGGERRED